jgi:hypothetical protein
MRFRRVSDQAYQVPVAQSHIPLFSAAYLSWSLQTGVFQHVLDLDVGWSYTMAASSLSSLCSTKHASLTLRRIMSHGAKQRLWLWWYISCIRHSAMSICGANHQWFDCLAESAPRCHIFGASSKKAACHRVVMCNEPADRFRSRRDRGLLPNLPFLRVRASPSGWLYRVFPGGRMPESICVLFRQLHVRLLEEVVMHIVAPKWSCMFHRR